MSERIVGALSVCDPGRGLTACFGAGHVYLRSLVSLSGSPLGWAGPARGVPGSARVCCSLVGNELLATIYVIGRTSERRVGHQMHGERCNVGRADDAPDGERGAQDTIARPRP